MERAPTPSAGRKILVTLKAAHYRQPPSFGDMVLTDRGLTIEIAQFQLGDLTFKYPALYVLLDDCHDIVVDLWSILGQEFGHYENTREPLH